MMKYEKNVNHNSVEYKMKEHTADGCTEIAFD
jgi:hypothetical protein